MSENAEVQYAYPYVVRGAHFCCTYGSHIRRIDMPVCHGAYIREKPEMHELDCEVGIEANIPPFGACSSPKNAGQQITISSGEDLKPLMDKHGEYYMPSLPVTGSLCIPVPGPRWCDPKEDKLVDGHLALTVNSTLVCGSFDGVIYFLDDGQEAGR